MSPALKRQAVANRSVRREEKILLETQPSHDLSGEYKRDLSGAEPQARWGRFPARLRTPDRTTVTESFHSSSGRTAAHDPTIENQLGGLIRANAADAIRPGANATVSNAGTILAIPISDGGENNA